MRLSETESGPGPLVLCYCRTRVKLFGSERTGSWSVCGPRTVSRYIVKEEPEVAGMHFRQWKEKHLLWGGEGELAG